jgi:hypothetical protein
MRGAVTHLHGWVAVMPWHRLTAAAGSAPTRRQLLSSARATSLSNGSADIDTSAVAVKGGSAVAEQAASQGKHSKVALAVGNTTTTAEQHSPVPDDPAASAPACPFAPTSLNSVKDRSGRLWCVTCVCAACCERAAKRVGSLVHAPLAVLAASILTPAALVCLTLLQHTPCTGAGTAAAPACSRTTAGPLRRATCGTPRPPALLAPPGTVLCWTRAAARGAGQTAPAAPSRCAGCAVCAGCACMPAAALQGMCMHDAPAHMPCILQDTPALGGSQDKGAAPRDMWASAPACPAGTPTDKAVMDRSGRKWGWAGNTSCAFKVRSGVCAHVQARRCDRPCAGH